jgi:hypothetical protein
MFKDMFMAGIVSVKRLGAQANFFAAMRPNRGQMRSVFANISWSSGKCGDIAWHL